MVTVEISEPVWRDLMLKKNPGESFDDVLRREYNLGNGTTDPVDTHVREEEPEPDDGPDDPLNELEFPAGVERDAALDTINEAIEYIQEQQGASKKEIVRAVMKDRPLKYSYDAAIEKIESPKRYRGAWWRRIVKPGLEASPRVVKPEPGQSEWQYNEA